MDSTKFYYIKNFIDVLSIDEPIDLNTFNFINDSIKKTRVKNQEEIISILYINKKYGIPIKYLSSLLSFDSNKVFRAKKKANMVDEDTNNKFIEYLLRNEDKRFADKFRESISDTKNLLEIITVYAKMKKEQGQPYSKYFYGFSRVSIMNHIKRL